MTVTLLVGMAAILALSRPKRIISDAAGSMVLVPGGDFIFGDDSPLSPNPQKKIASERLLRGSDRSVERSNTKDSVRQPAMRLPAPLLSLPSPTILLQM